MPSGGNSILQLPENKDYLEWDTYAWSEALNEWRNYLRQNKIRGGKALEIGAKNGGLTLFLSIETDAEIISSDLNGVTGKAKDLHKKFNVQEKIKYDNADAVNLKYDSETFNIVIMKSVLGSVGKNDNKKNHEAAVREIHRVLKTGGVFLFAENAKASFLHSEARKFFRKWASYWRYLTKNEMDGMLQIFSERKIYTFGFLSAFAPGDFIKKMIYPLDKIISRITPSSSHYIIYGYAKK
ncbi:MAG: class I SAM-dependent methyltransferase [Ignavibacteria bacterium]|nr:class I SAM-dependent methyltransferase [Ignavibacteria bacterium]